MDREILFKGFYPCEKGLRGGCPHDGGADVYSDYDYDCEMKQPLTRPPKSWRYVSDGKPA